MSLVTKVHSSFWSDEQIGALAPAGKLAVLWVLTNRDINNLGYLKISPRQFEFDTGLKLEALEEAVKGLPRTFIMRRDAQGFRVLALNFIYYQFSDAVNNPANNVHRHLRVLLDHAEPWVRRAVEARYKGLRRGLANDGHLTPQKLICGTSSQKPLTRGFSSLARDQSRAEQRRAEQSPPPEEGVQGGEGAGGQVAAAAPDPGLERRASGSAVRASQVQFAALRDLLRALEAKGADRTRQECELLKKTRAQLAELQARQREGRF